MRNQPRRGFTLIELLVVIGIIVVLIGLLIPVVAKVRTTAYVANTTNLMKNISAAATAYQLNFRAYPGVLPNKAYNYTSADQTPAFYFTPAGTGVYDTFTQSEDLVVALSGGLFSDMTVPGSKLQFDSAYLGQGPVNFNPLNPGKSPAFMPANAADLSPIPPANAALALKAPKLTLGDPEVGSIQTWVTDSRVPEFMDKFPDPRPIIYVRANSGAKNSAPGATTSTIVSNGYDPTYHYNYKAIAPYLNFTDDAELLNNKKNKAGTPLDASVIDYFTSPQSSSTAKYAGTYILISTGPDRKYGTPDDILMGGGGGGQ